MKNTINICVAIALLTMMSCSGKKETNANSSDVDSVALSGSLRPDKQHHPSLDKFEDGHVPPPPPDGRGFDGPPPHSKGHQKPDNMRGFDPASEDDMDDNGMSRYMENDDDEGWD